jgi:hypothetical protein
MDRDRRGGRGGGFRGFDGDAVLPADRNGVPTWEVDPGFKGDVFTFVRVRYSSNGGRRSGNSWATDFPDSELNFSFRLQQLTSMKVNPEPIWLELTDERIYDYPFLYMLEVGGLSFSEEEITNLRRYLLNGGFLMVDDFWGEWQYENFYNEIKRVFPDREPSELDLTHEIFQRPYHIKEKPQVPGINAALNNRGTGRTWEGGTDGREVHYKGIFDDQGRMMVIICHNTDLGDGWEREGVAEFYFHEFSEKKAYPMGINIVFYAMTH